MDRVICSICQEEMIGETRCVDPNAEGIHCGARACILACEFCQEWIDVVVECAPDEPKKEKGK